METLARFVPARTPEGAAGIFRRGLRANLLFLGPLAVVFAALAVLPVSLPGDMRPALPLVFLAIAAYAIYATGSGMLRGQGRLHLLPRLDLLWNFGAKFAALGVALLLPRFLPSYGAHTATQLLVPLLALYLLRGQGWGPASRLTSEEARFCRFILVWDVVRILITQVDIFVLRALMEPHDVGIYAAGTRLIKVGEQIVLGPMMAPLLYYFSHPESSFMRNDVIRHGTRLAGAAMGLFALILAALAAPIVTIFLGGAYRESIPVAELYVCFGLGRGLVIFLIPLYNSLNRPEYGILQGLLTVVVNLALDLILIPRYGPVGAAASAVVAITLSTLAATWFVQARLDIPILGPVLRTYFVFAVAFAAGVLGHPWVGIAFFLLALVPARLVRRRDLRWFRRGFRGGGAGNGET
jgi:O-antigen/teichoic acid export membrane protein